MLLFSLRGLGFGVDLTQYCDAETSPHSISIVLNSYGSLFQAKDGEYH